MEVKQFMKGELQKLRATIDNIQQQFNIKQTQGEFMVTPLVSPSPIKDAEEGMEAAEDP